MIKRRYGQDITLETRAEAHENAGGQGQQAHQRKVDQHPFAHDECTHGELTRVDYTPAEGEDAKIAFRTIQYIIVEETEDEEDDHDHNH